MTMTQVLLTNDDGFDAPGLLSAWNALRLIPGLQIEVIAPARCHSGAGHTLTDELRIDRRPLDPFGEIRVVDGTPVDCVCTAVHLPNRPAPNWVVAGINRGGNLGVDVYTSGTVAAARQAAIFGIPAVAISQLVRKPLPDDWQTAARQAAAVLAALIAPASETPTGLDADLYTAARDAFASVPTTPGAPCWNVNLPRLPDGSNPLGIRLAPLSRDPVHLEYAHQTNPDGSETLLYTGSYINRPAAPGTDVEAAFAGYITLTPLPL